MIDNNTRNPYNLVEYKKDKLKIFNSKKDDKTRTDLVDYLFGFQISGTNDNNLLLLETGYINSNKDNNYFILDEDDIDKLIEKLQTAKERIIISKIVSVRIKELHGELNRYLDAGYIESITMELKKNSLPPYFQPQFYKAFIIKPNFKKDIDIPSDVNTGFNFIEVLHLDINEGKFDETMNYIRNYCDIPIHFIGYDHGLEIEKRKKEALRDLDKRTKDPHKYGRSPEDIAKYKKMMEELGIPKDILNKK